MRRKQYISALLALSAIVTACNQKSETNAERNEKRAIVTQSDKVSQIPITEDSYADVSSVTTDSEARKNSQSVVTISDHLIVIDSSNGTAGVYRIKANGLAQCIQPNDDWSEFEDSDTVSGGFYPVLDWSHGQGVDWINITDDVSTDTYEIYFPPENIQFQTFDSIEPLSESDLVELQSLPNGIDDHHTAICRYELNLESYPEKKRSTAPFLQQDKVYYYRIVSTMDNIPLCDCLYTSSNRTLYVCEWEDVIGPAIASSILPISTILTKDDKLVHYSSLPSISVTETIVEPQKLVTYQEALESIDEAVSYQIEEYGGKEAYVFAVALEYSTLSEYDQTTKQVVMNDEAIAVPVWRFYYYEHGGYGDGVTFADINAVTGESIYSKEFPYGDERFFSNEI